MKSVLQNLFDLSFDNFIAMHLVRVTFILGCGGVFVGLVELAGTQNINGEPAFWLFGFPILFIACVSVLRVTLEMYVALVRIAENTTKLVKMKESKEALWVMRNDQTE